jgi:hypothetical protein
MSLVLAQVSWIAIGYGVLVSLVALWAGLKWRARPPWLGQLVWMLEVLMLLRAGLGAAALAGGDRPESMTTHVGYLITSVCVLPLAMQAVRDDDTAWAAGVIAIAAIAVTVVGVRILATV